MKKFIIKKGPPEFNFQGSPDIFLVFMELENLKSKSEIVNNRGNRFSLQVSIGCAGLEEEQGTIGGVRSCQGFPGGL